MRPWGDAVTPNIQQRRRVKALDEETKVEGLITTHNRWSAVLESEPQRASPFLWGCDLTVPPHTGFKEGHRSNDENRSKKSNPHELPWYQKAGGTARLPRSRESR